MSYLYGCSLRQDNKFTKTLNIERMTKENEVKPKQR